MKRVAVIGAGIVGVTTAHELVADGWDVTVFERRATVAAETSFANAGVVAPGYVTPWAAPGMPSKVLRYLWRRHAPVRIAGTPSPALLRWMWRWWRSCDPALYARHRGAMQALALYSRAHLSKLAEALQIDYERASGYLVLLRGPRDVELARPGLALMADLGVPVRLVDAAACREIEPALNPATALQAGIHLPNDEVGNCRQFAHALKAHCAQRGAHFRFRTEVTRLQAGDRPRLTVRAMSDGEPAPESVETFDAVVVCAALGSARLLAPSGLRLPMAPVYGYSVTAPLSDIGALPRSGVQSGVMDERYKVAITRLGDRIRVAGVAELAGHPERHDPAALETLYQVLDDWFPGVARWAKAQAWKGARPMLPDGPPILGASGIDGIWLNVGHGSSGWALACGSARVLADRMAGRPTALDTSAFDVSRLR